MRTKDRDQCYPRAQNRELSLQSQTWQEDLPIQGQDRATWQLLEAENCRAGTVLSMLWFLPALPRATPGIPLVPSSSDGWLPGEGVSFICSTHSTPNPTNWSADRKAAQMEAPQLPLLGLGPGATASEEHCLKSSHFKRLWEDISGCLSLGLVQEKAPKSSRKGPYWSPASALKELCGLGLGTPLL